MPFVLIGGLIALAGIIGFGAVWSTLGALIGLVPAAGAATMAAAGRVYQEAIFRLRFLVFIMVVLSIVCGLLGAWGIWRDGTYMQKMVPTAIAGGVLVGFAFFVTVIGDELERVLRRGIDVGGSILWFFGSVILGFLSLFKITEKLGPRPARVRAHRTVIEALGMPGVLLAFWDVAFLIAFPSPTTLGMLVGLDVILLALYAIARYLRKDPTFWALSYAFILPALAIIVVLRSTVPTVAPKQVALSGRSWDRTWDRLECWADGAESTNQNCYKRRLPGLEEDGEETGDVFAHFAHTHRKPKSTAGTSPTASSGGGSHHAKPTPPDDPSDETGSADDPPPPPPVR